MKFGRWTVVRQGSERRKWLCRCTCGNTREVFSPTLINGQSQSCGCRNKEIVGDLFRTHGKTGTLLYRRWKNMRNRCNNPNNPSYKHYGGRGINVCRRWDDFETFLADMGTRPPGTEIDRRNNEGNYEPDNCRWASHKEQSENMRRNHIIEFDGKSLTLSQWSAITGIAQSTLRARLSKFHWPIIDALNTPVRKKTS